MRANEELAAAVQYFANYIAKPDEYGHAADGKRPAQRAKEYGYDYCIVMENIAYAFDSRGFDEKERDSGCNPVGVEAAAYPSWRSAAAGDAE